MKRTEELRVKGPSPLAKLEQNYINATYIATRYGKSRVPSRSKEREQRLVQLQDTKKMENLYRKENQKLGNAIYVEKEHRKKIQNELQLFKLAFQQLETTNQKFQNKQTVDITPTETPMMSQSQTQHFSTSAGDLFKGAKKINSKPKRKRGIEAAVQTDEYVCECANLKLQVQSLKNELADTKEETGKQLQSLREQNKTLTDRNLELEKSIENLAKMVEENKNMMKKALSRERYSVQNLKKFSESVGITEQKLQQFIKQSPVSHEFELGSIDKTTSEVFREHILYLMYLSNKQNQAHELKISQLQTQLQIQSQLSETCKRDLTQCKQTIKQLTDLIISSTTLTNAIKRECRKVADSMDKLGKG